MSMPDPHGSPLPIDDPSPTIRPADEDHALTVLLKVRAQVTPDLPEDLLRQCYAIQNRFQFDRDEQLPIVHTRRLVEGYVEREAGQRANLSAEGDA
jgi:hypothetical protein